MDDAETKEPSPSSAGAGRRRVTISRLWTLLFLLLGFGLMAGLFAVQDIGEIADAIGRAGWGIAAITLFHLVPVGLDAAGLGAVVPREHRPSYPRLFGIQWITEAINQLLPVAQIGGEFIKTRLLVLGRVPAIQAGASVVVNLTLGIFTQGLFAIIGIVILVLQYGEGGGATVHAAIGAGIILASVALFFMAQRIGLFSLVARFVKAVTRGREWLSLVGGAGELDAMVATLYRRRGAVLRSMVYQLVSWLIGTGEVMLALHFMGHDVSLVDAMMIEALGQAVRSAAFLVPASLGVQEGGYVLLGTIIGLSPETALALSLIKRVREIGLGLPGLIAWQIIEGRRWLMLRR